MYSVYTGTGRHKKIHAEIKAECLKILNNSLGALSIQNFSF